MSSWNINRIPTLLLFFLFVVRFFCLDYVNWVMLQMLNITYVLFLLLYQWHSNFLKHCFGLFLNFFTFKNVYKYVRCKCLLLLLFFIFNNLFVFVKKTRWYHQNQFVCEHVMWIHKHPLLNFKCLLLIF